MAAVMKTATATGSVASFWSPKPAAIKSLKVYFEPKQAGEGDPSPDNVRPIEGWTGIETWKTGKNLFDESAAIFGYWTSADGTVGTNIRGVRSNYIPTEGGSTYTVMYHGTPPYSYSFVELDENYNFVTRTHKQIYGTSDSFYKPLSVTIQDKTKYFYIQTYRLSEQMTPEYLSSIKIQLEYGNSASDYEPYSDNKTTISWESQIGTVYGGYVDLISGEVWKTHHYYAFTGDESFLSLGSNWVVVYLPKINNVNPTASLRFSGVCSHYPYRPFHRGEIGVMTNESDCTFDGTIYNAEGWKAYTKTQYEAGTPIEVSYELKTPTLLGTLTPQQLSAFIGRNNFFSNATKVEVEYEYADSPELEVIKKRIALNEPHISNASGSIANFYTDMASPMKSLKVNFEAKQSGTGDPSPDNVRSITGVDQINVCVSGKNIAHITGYSAKSTNSPGPDGIRSLTNDYGTTISTTSPENEITITQTQFDNTVDIAYYRNGYFVMDVDTLEFDKPYIVSFKLTNVTKLSEDSELTNIRVYNPRGNGYGVQVEGDRLICSKYVHRQLDSSPNRHNVTINNCGMSFTLSDFMMTPATETDQTYEPYTGNIIPCSFSELGTQYGGYVDLVNGTLTKTWTKLTTTWGELDAPGTVIGNNTRKTFTLPIVGINDEENSIFNAGPYIWSNSQDVPHYYINSTGRVLYVVLPNDTDSSFPIEVAYKLAEPITYQLTPQQIKTFRGTNNIYSFDGTVDVKYWLHSDVKTERKTVVWNNKCNGYISDADWKDRNTDETHTTFEDGVATIDFYNSPGSFHTMVQKISPSVSLNNKYYASYWFKPNKATDGNAVGAEFAGGAQIYNYLQAEPGNWYHISVMANGRRDGTGAMYIPFVGSQIVAGGGLIAQVKSPVYVDLTQMFGAGNEPATPEEFEHLCAINGVDLTKPQAYDEGTERSWIIN